MLGVRLLYNFMYLFLSDFAALPVKHLGEALLRDKARVVRVEVMEGEHEILHSQCLFLVHGRCQKFTIVNSAGVMEVNRLKDIIKVHCWDIRILKGLFHLVEIQKTRVGFIQGSEGFSEGFEVNHVFGEIIHQEGKSLDLQTLRSSEFSESINYFFLV